MNHIDVAMNEADAMSFMRFIEISMTRCETFRARILRAATGLNVTAIQARSLKVSVKAMG